MGSCQTKSKLKSQKDLNHTTQKKQSDPLFTNNNPSVILHTFSPNPEIQSEPNERNVNSLKIQKCSYTRFYSEISSGNQLLLNNQKLVQHNLTGKIRIVEQYERNSINEQFINELSLQPPDHPRIATIYELFLEDEQYSLIIDYCSGGLLSNYYTNKQVIPFQEHEIATIIYQAAEALRYLQKIGITHGHLTLQSFSRIDSSYDFQIKLTDIKGLYIKHEIDQNNILTLSPEACNPKYNNHYDYSRDLWSLGVITYHMICGYPPFEGNTINSVKTQIKKSAAIYNNFQFDRASKQCRQLIEKVLVPIKSRISLEEFLNDQWFKIKIRQTDQNILKKLEQNKVKISQLQQQFLLFMIKNFCSSDQQKLYNEFVLLDENQDGFLTKEELLKVYSKKFDSKTQAIQFIDNIFKLADSDKSGTIDFGEFLVAITDKSGLLTDDNLKISFKMLAASNGQLIPQKLKFHFGMSPARLETLFAEHFPKNQTIGIQEYEYLMKQLL